MLGGTAVHVWYNEQFPTYGKTWTDFESPGRNCKARALLEAGAARCSVFVLSCTIIPGSIAEVSRPTCEVIVKHSFCYHQRKDLGPERMPGGAIRAYGTRNRKDPKATIDIDIDRAI